MRWVIATVTLAVLVGAADRASAADAYEFSYDTLLLAFMKLDKNFDFEEHADAYMQLYRPQVWNRVRNNEFELEAKRRETVGQMKERVGAFSLDRDIVLLTTLELGKYDLKRKSFPVLNMSETNYWNATHYNDGSFPSRFRVFLANHALLAEVPMEVNQAQQFVRLRTDRWGDVNRNVAATIRLRIQRAKEPSGDLLGAIKSATLYADNNRRWAILTVSLPDSAQVAETDRKP